MGARGLATGVLVASVLILAPTPAAAPAGSLGSASELATPAFPSPVAAAGGVIAWASPSGSGHRFEVVIRSGGRTRALARTSAAGWIDGVKLGTDAHGRAIVVYSRCPHSPFASASAGSAGSDGCRLWWAPLSGASPRLIPAAPADATVGTASAGTVVFAVEPNTGRRLQPARLQMTTLTGHTARSLPLSRPDGATITDLSTSGGEVAFIEEPLVDEPRTSPSQVWLDAPGAAPRLLAQQISDAVPIDDEARYFDGLTLTGGEVYAFLYASAGINPPVASELEQIPLSGPGAAAAAPWLRSGPFSAFGIQASAFDAGAGRLVLDLFSPRVDLSTPSGACSPHASSRSACPILATGPVSFP